MKFKRSTLFSILLLPLMLTSCGGNTPTTTPSNPGSGSTTQKPTPDSTKPTDKGSTTSSLLEPPKIVEMWILVRLNGMKKSFN